MNQRRDRDEHAKRFPVQFFQMTGAGWNGSPKASPNTKRPKRTDQTPPTAVTKRMRHQMLFGSSRIAATTPRAMNRAPYPTSPIMNPKKNGAAINRNNVGSSSW